MKYIVIVSLIIIGIFFLANVKTTVRNEAVVNELIGREEAYKNNFIKACIEESEMKQACQCMYDYVTVKYTYDERIELDDLVRRGETPQAVYDAIIHCKSSFE